MPVSFEPAPHGLQRIAAGALHPRHAHAAPYAALVLRGRYEEAGSGGRFAMREGDVLFHGAFDAHCDRFERAEAQILNLTLPADWRGAPGAAQCADVGAVLRARDPREAAALLCERATPTPPLCADWPDVLVADLLRDPALDLARWAQNRHLSRETLSRGLRRLYGVTPARLRREIRARKAFTLIANGTQALVAVAQEAGFADQAHMTREVAQFTGRAPGQWRAASSL